MDDKKLFTAGKKTFKREVAVVMLAMLFAGWAFTMWDATTEQRIQLVELMIIPVIGFAAAAYGMATYQRQDDKRMTMDRYSENHYDPSYSPYRERQYTQYEPPIRQPRAFDPSEPGQTA